MGVLTDIVVAKSSEAEKVLASGLQAYPGFAAKRLDHVTLGKLAGLLTKKAAEVKAVSGMAPLADGGEQWVFQIPAAMVKRLAALDETEAKRIASAWAKAEEFKGDRMKPANVADMLRELAKYARQATAQKKDLLLWMSC